MKKVWTRSALVALIAVLATQAISLSVRYLLDAPADTTTVLMGLVIPILITMPISGFVFRQTEKLDRANAALLVANETLARKASHDQMTGLLNRESFFNRLDVSRISDGGTLLIIDADHFKRINDRFGHPTGDDALIRIARSIEAAVRKGDFVGRVGGEEFGAFLVGADRQEGLRIAQRLRGAVESAGFAAPEGARIELSVSVGGAIAHGQPTLDDLVREADGCLYEAKRAGRNRVIIERGLTVAA